MIKELVTFSIKQRWMVIIVTVFMAIYGAILFDRLPVQAFPDVQNVYVVVITQYPNQAPEEVEKLVSMPIERALTGTPHLMNLRSVSMFGLSVVTATFNDDAEDYFSRQQVLERLRLAELPEQAKPVLGPLSTGIGEIYRYVLRSENLPLTEQRALQDWVITPYIKSVPGVAEVSSFGGMVKQYQVNLDPERLRSFNMTIADVMSALADNNANSGGGYLNSGEQTMVVRGIGLLTSTEDIASVVIREQEGVPIHVRDVGKVEIGFQTRTGIVGYNQHDDVTLGYVQMTKGGDAVDIVAGVKQRIYELNHGILPAGTKIEMVYDRTQLVSHTISTVEENLLHGALLVVGILFIFLLQPLAALAVGLIIPLSLLFAFIFVSINHISANLVSLGAIDFGIIVDSAVVLVEAVMVKITLDINNQASRGHMHQSLITASTQMIRPILFSKLILIAAFLPVLTFQQVEGKIFSPMAMTLSFALLGSVLLTLFLIPALLSFFLGKPLAERHNPVFEWLKNSYEGLIARLLAFPKPFLAMMFLFLVLSFSVVKWLGTEFMPKLDEGNIWLTVTMPTATSLEQAKSTERVIRQRISEFSEVKTVLTHLGRPEDGTDTKGFNHMEILIDLQPKETWHYATKLDIIADMKTHFSDLIGIEFNFSQLIQDSVEEAISGAKGEIVVKLFGYDLEVMQEKANQIVDILKAIPGSADVATERQTGLGELNIEIDRDKAARYGIRVADINLAIENAIGGGTATEILEGEKRFDLQVRLMSEGRNSVANISNLLISNAQGSRIPLGEVANIRVTEGANRISRENQYRRIAIKSNLFERDQGSFVREAMSKVSTQVELPSGYRIVWSGQFENQQRAMSRLFVIVPISLLLIFGLLFWAFMSVPSALLIMLTVPFALAGGLLTLYFLHISLSISAAVGFIVLFGIAVQNGVILLEQINLLQEEGADLLTAVKAGSASRLRPVLMTALMAMLGLLPAALSTGVGAEATKPFAIAIIGGLITATIATLTLLPILYYLLYRRAEIAQNELTARS